MLDFDIIISITVFICLTEQTQLFPHPRNNNNKCSFSDNSVQFCQVIQHINVILRLFLIDDNFSGELEQEH